LFSDYFNRHFDLILAAMNRIYLSLGSNLGDRKKNLELGNVLLEELAGHVTAKSAVYETEPWGFNSDLQFYNQAILLLSKRDPRQMLDTIHEIERRCGRDPERVRNAPRTLDMDILFFNDLILDTPELVIPHPSLQLRRFVLVPLSEIGPKLIHPLLKREIEDLLGSCADDKSVVPILT
jgi:2-amino-4-hydroxy-6-hydroxymethyldihydropteridine diphosphokinase